MHRRVSEICARYGMAYWLWMPANIDLRDSAKRAGLLKKNEAIFRGCAHLTGVFVPGGDPGDNAPEVLIPFLQETAEQLMAIHPKARILVLRPRLYRKTSQMGLRLSAPRIADLARRFGGRSFEPAAAGAACRIAAAISVAPLPRSHA